LATLEERVGAVEGQCTDAAASAATANGYLEKAGLTRGDTAQQLLAAANRVSTAEILEQRVQDLEAGATTAGVTAEAFADRLKRLEQQAAAGSTHGEVLVWAPTGMADTIRSTLTAAAGLSQNSILFVQEKLQPRPRGSNGDSSSGGAPGGSGRGEAGRSDRPAVSSGTGSSRQPRSMYLVRLVSSSLVPTVLGGRTRLALARQNAPMWLDRVLTEEERRERRQLVPVARELRAKGVKTRWRGHILEQLQQRSAGRQQWERVQVSAERFPLPPLSPPRGPAATGVPGSDADAS
jgi:hypothetical protein